MPIDDDSFTTQLNITLFRLYKAAADEALTHLHDSRKGTLTTLKGEVIEGTTRFWDNTFAVVRSLISDAAPRIKEGFAISESTGVQTAKNICLEFMHINYAPSRITALVLHDTLAALGVVFNPREEPPVYSESLLDQFDASFSRHRQDALLQLPSTGPYDATANHAHLASNLWMALEKWYTDTRNYIAREEPDTARTTLCEYITSTGDVRSHWSIATDRISREIARQVLGDMGWEVETQTPKTYSHNQGGLYTALQDAKTMILKQYANNIPGWDETLARATGATRIQQAEKFLGPKIDHRISRAHHLFLHPPEGEEGYKAACDYLRRMVEKGADEHNTDDAWLSKFHQTTLKLLGESLGPFTTGVQAATTSRTTTSGRE